jgi:hypothetical protein
MTDGASVESTGYPVNPDFQEFQGNGILWFAVSTIGGTVSCYAEGTNTWVLRDIGNRLARVVAWNGQRLAEGAEPVAVRVEGTYDARRGAIHVARVEIPRGAGNSLVQPVVWDSIDPNRGDGVVTGEYYDPPASDGFYGYDRPAGTYAEYPPVVVNNYYYDYNVYEEPYEYPRYRSRYYSSYPRYGGGYYPVYPCPSYPHKPQHPIHRPGRPGHRPGYKHRDSGTESPGIYSGFYLQPPAATVGRAERWGQARKISRVFTNPSLSTTWKPYLNPSQLPEFQAEFGRGGGSGDTRDRGFRHDSDRRSGRSFRGSSHRGHMGSGRHGHR